MWEGHRVGRGDQEDRSEGERTPPAQRDCRKSLILACQ
jgi:hypothetical protein